MGLKKKVYIPAELEIVDINNVSIITSSGMSSSETSSSGSSQPIIFDASASYDSDGWL